MTLRMYKDKTKNISFLLVLYVLFVGFFTYNFGISESALYLSDALNIILIFLTSKRLSRSFVAKDLRSSIIVLFLLLLVSTFSAMINGFSPMRWLWSIRNWGRFFSFFFVCIVVLDKDLVDRLMSFAVNLFHVNTIVIILQYFLLGKRGDSLNGLVGRNVSGANIILSITAFIVVASCYALKKCHISELLLSFLEVGIVSVLSELKALVLFAAFIIVVLTLVNSVLTGYQILRYIRWILFAFGFSFISLYILVKFYPYFASILSWEGLIAAVTTESGYGNQGYIDRFTAVSVINKYFFDSMGLGTKLFGLGMGNAEYSAVSALQSPFYRSYGHTFRYLNFSVSMLYLETGLIGLLLFILFNIILVIKCIKNIRKGMGVTNADNGDAVYWNVGLGVTIISIIYIWYTNVHRTDMAFLLAIYMAIPWALRNKEVKQ